MRHKTIHKGPHDVRYHNLLSTVQGNTTGSALVAGGGALGGLGSLVGGFNQSATDNNTAALYREQAQLDTFNAGTKVQANEERAQQTIGAANASAGAAGVTAGGSPTLANAKTISDANVQDIYARYSGKIQSTEDLYQAQLESWAGNQAKLAGIAGAGMSVIGAGATLSGV
jgi:hypothetical protein